MRTHEGHRTFMGMGRVGGGGLRRGQVTPKAQTNVSFYNF